MLAGVRNPLEGVDFYMFKRRKNPQVVYRSVYCNRFPINTIV